MTKDVVCLLNDVTILHYIDYTDINIWSVLTMLTMFMGKVVAQHTLKTKLLK